MPAAGATMEVMSDTPKQPYQTLGNHLRYLREQQMESLAEVSGAVEIDETLLERIEAGHVRPSEDILLLLISHFNMQDQEAVQLWELAGYDGSERRQQEELVQEVLQGHKSAVFVVAMDTRTAYTDSVNIESNAAGIVMRFGQLNSKRQAQPVANVGMSYEQAEQVLQQLQIALLRNRYLRNPRQLPPPSDVA